MKPKIIIILSAIALVIALVIIIINNNNYASDSKSSTIDSGETVWYVFSSKGGLTGNHEYIAISRNNYPANIQDNQRYTFYTNEIYYKIDSCGVLNIYAPYSVIEESLNNDTTIKIHELKDYDSWNKVIETYQSLGLKRLSIEGL